MKSFLARLGEILGGIFLLLLLLFGLSAEYRGSIIVRPLILLLIIFGGIAMIGHSARQHGDGSRYR